MKLFVVDNLNGLAAFVLAIDAADAERLVKEKYQTGRWGRCTVQELDMHRATVLGTERY